MNLGQLRTQTRYYLDDNSSVRWTDIEVDSYVNQAYENYFNKLVTKSYEGLLTTPILLNINSGVNEIALPPDFFQGKILYRVLPNKKVPCIYKSPYDNSVLSTYASSVYRPAYSFNGMNLLLDPTPSDNVIAGLELHYWSQIGVIQTLLAPVVKMTFDYTITSGDFILGEIITDTTSSATGTLQSITLDPLTNVAMITLVNVAGAITNGDVLTGGTSGAVGAVTTTPVSTTISTVRVSGYLVNDTDSPLDGFNAQWHQLIPVWAAMQAKSLREEEDIVNIQNMLAAKEAPFNDMLEKMIIARVRTEPFNTDMEDNYNL